MEQIRGYIEENKERFIEELFGLLRIPSVSADNKYRDSVIRTAEAVADRIIEAGADNVEIINTALHPIVYAEKIINPALPTVLIYGHYDVQPADPLELWHTPPFEPVIRDAKIYARGSCDDKGQMYMYIKAFELMMRTDTLPCNIRFLFEGEEEIGSPSLPAFIDGHRHKLHSDIIILSDTNIIANDIPSITVGLRGLAYVEVELTGPNRDLHSGIYGGAVANPINILCDMIASLHDQNGRITIPGFYDDLEIVSIEEREEMAKAPFDLGDYKKKLDIADVYGESGYSTMERGSIRPTLDVNGIWGGYTGEGSKTVLPSKAYAKISMRLVPYQSEKKILELFTNHFKSIAPPSVTVNVRHFGGGNPASTPITTVAYQAAAHAMSDSFGTKPIPTRSGVSIPVVALLKEHLGLDSVMMGFGLDTDSIHSPNEHYGVFNYLKGIETIPLFFKYYTELMRR